MKEDLKAHFLGKTDLVGLLIFFLSPNEHVFEWVKYPG